MTRLRLFIALLIIISINNVCITNAEAFQRKRVRQTVSYVQSSGGFATAQAVANHMANVGYVGHWGGNNGYEGCGMGPTPYAAEMNCCYRSRPIGGVGPFIPREVGIARGANGLYYACCRF